MASRALEALASHRLSKAYHEAVDDLRHIRCTQQARAPGRLARLNNYYDLLDRSPFPVEDPNVGKLFVQLDAEHDRLEKLRQLRTHYFGAALIAAAEEIGQETGPAQILMWDRLDSDWAKLRSWRKQHLDGKDVDLRLCWPSKLERGTLTTAIFTAWAKALGQKPSDAFRKCVQLLSLAYAIEHNETPSIGDSEDAGWMASNIAAIRLSLDERADELSASMRP